MIQSHLKIPISVIITTTILKLAFCGNYEFYAERAELLYTNNSFLTNPVFHFGKVNRTFRGVNASFDVVKDFTNQKIMATLKAYQFYHNEYRFTGTQITADICKIERANIFSMKEQFKEAQFDMNLCNVKKGTYKIVNFAPQAKYFPSYLPLGKALSNIRLHDGHGSDFFSLNWYFEVRGL